MRPSKFLPNRGKLMAENQTIKPHILLVESTFYEDISEELAKGAIQRLNDDGMTYERVKVPGCFEIPAAIKYAIKSMQLFCGDDRFHGFIALGCVIRGETTHYDYICEQCTGGLQKLTLEYALAMGNGVLTVENRKQAMARAKVNEGNKGGAAAEACLEMIALKTRFGLIRE
jgi:6,7-dimethyl-8-ribityllumazine synthase